MSSVHAREKKSKKKSTRERTESTDDVSTQYQIQAKMETVKEKVETLKKLVMGTPLSTAFENVEEKIDQTLNIMSPKKQGKYKEPNFPEQSTSHFVQTEEQLTHTTGEKTRTKHVNVNNVLDSQQCTTFSFSGKSYSVKMQVANIYFNHLLFVHVHNFILL